MGRFAHIADVHLGYQKSEALKEVERDIFTRIVDECVARKVNFVLVCGDLFHVNIPHMETNVHAFEQFHRLRKAGIPVYAVYGSHDFSPTAKSIIDLLQASDLITKVTAIDEGDGVNLKFVTDPKTGAKIVGLPGLKAGRDIDLYENLDREPLEAEEGFKIFMFHGAIRELIRQSSPSMDSMPLSMLPRNFSYYAGGHIHTHTYEEYPNYPRVVYPGTPFSGYSNDLEENARGQSRGFVVVDFDEKVSNVEFVEIKAAKYEIIDICCKNKKASSVNSQLQDEVHKANAKSKIVVIKIAGELATGKTADVDVTAARAELRRAGALDIIVHKNQLTSMDYNITAVKGSTREEIVHNIFAENVDNVKTRREELAGEAGVSLAESLLSELEQPKLENENNETYERRVAYRVLGIMEVSLDDS